MREIAWERFFKLVPRDPQESSAIDTRLAPELFDLPSASRCWRGGRCGAGSSSKLPSGQDLAKELGAPPSTRSDLLLDEVPDPTRETLAASTPLWYWILCEGEKAGGGTSGRSAR